MSKYIVNKNPFRNEIFQSGLFRNYYKQYNIKFLQKNSYKYSYSRVVLTIRLIWATHICDLTSSRVTVGLTMIQRLVKWCLNLFPLFLFLSSLLLLLALILSSILGSSWPLSFSLFLSMCVVFFRSLLL